MEHLIVILLMKVLISLNTIMNLWIITIFDAFHYIGKIQTKYNSQCISGSGYHGVEKSGTTQKEKER